MTKNVPPKLPLTPDERNRLRREKMKLSDIADMEPVFLAGILDTSTQRARILIALATFQRIPSVGPRFAQDLVDLGYFSLDELKEADGAKLFDDLERLHGREIDPCVEDQFRLVVDYANNPERGKFWWDFTEERKAYRAQFGYPKSRTNAEKVQDGE
ncbi:conserved hypothetical protein [[Clostridium] ultunense Esp]|nr:conserved hypothetical protein [[Clostridium] ultunense Esp]